MRRLLVALSIPILAAGCFEKPKEGGTIWGQLQPTSSTWGGGRPQGDSPSPAPSSAPTPDASPSAGPSPIASPSPAVPPVTATFTGSYARMEAASCFGCHAAGSAYGDLKSLTTESAWVKGGWVIPGKPTESLLIRKLKPSKSPIATMPPGVDYPQADFDYLVAWIAAIPEVAPSPSPTPAPTGAGTDQFAIRPQTAGIEQFLGQLARIYSTAGDGVRRFSSLAVKWRGFWGGGCDRYRASITGVGNNGPIYDEPTAVCSSEGLSDGPLGSGSVIKAGARINACEYFTNSDAYMSAFFTGILGGATAFTKANAEKAFHAYYPTATFTDAIYNGFLQTSEAVHPAIKLDEKLRWRLFLSTLCQSQYWEIL